MNNCVREKKFTHGTIALLWDDEARCKSRVTSGLRRPTIFRQSSDNVRQSSENQEQRKSEAAHAQCDVRVTWRLPRNNYDFRGIITTSEEKEINLWRHYYVITWRQFLMNQSFDDLLIDCLISKLLCFYICNYWWIQVYCQYWLAVDLVLVNFCCLEANVILYHHMWQIVIKYIQVYSF